MSTAVSDDDFDMPDDEERKFRARRLFTYSVRALNAAIELDALYINHPQVKTTLEGLDRVFQLGRALSLSQGLSVIGDTGCGKTALLTHFQRSLPLSSDIRN